MTNNPFTAAQIARALGIKRQAAQRLLSGIAPSGQVVVSGRPVNAWPISALPAHSQELLASRAQTAGCRDIDQFLSTPAKHWEPLFPLAEVAQDCVDRAIKLQRALHRVPELQDDLAVSSAELERIGLEDYQCEFGHAISARHLRNLVKRTLDRDGGAGQFARVELFLDEKPARKHATAPVISLDVQTEYRELQDVIATFKNPVAPADAEKDYLWLRTFELFEEKLAAGKAAKKVKNALVKYLARNARFMAANAEALRVMFNRKYSRWIESDRAAVALQDGRKEKSGFHRALELPEQDKKLLTAAAAKLGGGRDQAWRMLYGRLSREVRTYYHNPARMPDTVRNQLRQDVAMEKVSLHGPRSVRTAGAYVNRDPNGIAAGDWDQSDDMTMVNVWWEESPESPEGFWFGQGQLLVWIDERSWLNYGWDLISDPYYDAFSIRNSWDVKAGSWGLPRKGLSLERGIWKTSRVLVGEKSSNRDGSEVPIIDTALGLRRLGLRFHNATHARVKVIERIYGLLQNYFQAAPGYVGRNPLTDHYEEVQKQIRLVKSGKAHPSDFFLHKQQWRQILNRVCFEFNDTPMNGKYHEGRSPKQVFEETFTSKLVKLPEELKYLAASNRYERRVTGNGISFQFGKQTFRYKGYELGRRRDKTVVAWFDCGNHEEICCTDLDGGNPFIVQREPLVYNHDPLPGTLEHAHAQNAAQNRYQKELHQSLKPYYNSDFFSGLFRPCVVDMAAVETSKEFARQKAVVRAEHGKEERQDARAHSLSRKLKMTLSPTAARRPETVPALERLNELLNEEEPV